MTDIPRPGVRIARALGLASVVAGLCAACSIDTFTYSVDRYGRVAATQLHLGCHDTYEVYDRLDAGSMLVVTNGVNESIAGLCDGGVENLPKAERLRRIARLFLEETSNRPGCRIVGERELQPWQTEFSYVCPAPEPVVRRERGARARRR